MRPRMTIYKSLTKHYATAAILLFSVRRGTGETKVSGDSTSQKMKYMCKIFHLNHIDRSENEVLYRLSNQIHFIF